MNLALLVLGSIRFPFCSVPYVYVYVCVYLCVHSWVLQISPFVF
jgi:hypothetical protein